MSLSSFIWVSVAVKLLAEPWSGIIDPSRAIDWSGVGVNGGIPSRTTICRTLSPGVSANQINSAIAGCPSGQVVFLGPGIYTLSGGIVIKGTNNVTLRGAGPTRTIIDFTGGDTCGGWGGDVCITNADPDCAGCGTPSNAADWTAGYAPGATSITLGNVSTGNISNLHLGTLLFLDQIDDPNADTGSIWVCQTVNVCSEEAGAQNGRPGRGQQQPVQVTSISGSGPWTIGISPAIRMPNWSGDKSPQAHWSNAVPVSGIGIEDLTLDHSATIVNRPTMAGITIVNGLNDWIKNVRDINSPHEHVMLYQTAHTTVRDSYFFGSLSAASQSYGTDIYNGADDLVENNIFEHVAQPMMTEGCVGCVFGYNYAADDWYTVSLDWQEQSSWGHSVGDDFVLWEGNQGVGLIGDNIHGTRHFITAFRNQWSGRDQHMTNGVAKTVNTNAVILNAYNRYFNIIGNVLGTSGYPTTDASQAAGATDSSSGSNNSIYVLGYSGSAGTNGGFPNDTAVMSTLMRWGNYDTVTGTVKFDATEVPSAVATYGNAVPPTQDLPASFYLSSKPRWWGLASWPAIGPDVTGGSMSGVGGHANPIPAVLCHDITPIDTNGTLLFDADRCYGAGIRQPRPSSSPNN